jgi:hypothetical protein
LGKQKKDKEKKKILEFSLFRGKMNNILPNISKIFAFGKQKNSSVFNMVWSIKKHRAPIALHLAACFIARILQCIRLHWRRTALLFSGREQRHNGF